MPSELITPDDGPEILAAMSQFAEIETGGDIRVEFEIGEGNAAAEILAAAATTGSDLIVMAPTADAGGLMQDNAPTIYGYGSLQALFDGEAGGAKAASPGASGTPVTERPASGSTDRHD
jgi:hypothetical protein